MEILLLGDIVIDNSYFGNSHRIAPEGPVPIVNISQTETSFGCIGNIIQSCKPFFKKIYVPLAFDNNDNKTINSLKSINRGANIYAKNFHQENRKIITKNRIYSNGKIISRYDVEEVNEINSVVCNEIVNFVKKLLPTLNIILISDYKKGFLSDTLLLNIIEQANINNIPIIVDPKGRDYYRYKNATLIKPNLKEAELFFGRKLSTQEDWAEYFHSLNKDLGIKYVLTTMSSRGMNFIYNKKETMQFIQKHIKPSTIVDVTGCGDSILAGIAVFYSHNGSFGKVDSLLECLTNIGSLSVTTPGCYTLTQYDWDKCYNNSKVVFTNGCFDLIHVGHLKLLKECKKLGSRLIIGINSDESIKILKGDTRPINCLKDRILFLKELEIADEIIPFDEDTPLELIKKTQPDILVKGGDYNLEDIVGHNIVQEVKIIPFVKSYSSTNIIKKIVKKNI